MRNISEEAKKSISELLSEAKDGIKVAQGLVDTGLFKEAIIKSWASAEKALTSICILSGIAEPEVAYKERILTKLPDLIESLPDNEHEIEFVKELYNSAAEIENTFQKINTKTSFSEQDAVSACNDCRTIVLEVEKHLFTRIFGS
jgi:HEPN domain-containing protein